MLKRAKVINEETKQCAVILGDGFKHLTDFVEQEVEESWNGQWYLAGYAPTKPAEASAREVRERRNQYLLETDKFMLSDYPITDEERAQYALYRSYLRDIPEQADFPDMTVMTFAERQAARDEISRMRGDEDSANE